MAQFRRPIQQEADGSNIPLLHDNECEHRGFLQQILDSLKSTWKTIFSELRGPQRLWTTLLATLLTSISPLLGGYTLGFASSALLQLNAPGVPTKYNIQGVYLALFAGLTTGGAAIGGFFAGYAADYLGRKSALLVSAFLGMIGWLLLMSANFWTHGGNPIGFVTTLLIGRFFTGGALGWGMLCTPLYIGEISPPGLRGLFGSFPQLALTFGFFLVYGLGAIPGFSYEYISLIAASITTVFVVLLVVTPWVPMTPRFLIMKGRWDEALTNLRWLRGPHVHVNEEAEEIRRVLESTERLTCLEFCSELKKRKSIISIILMVFVMAFQQFSGIHVLAIFAGDIFKDAGFHNPQFIATMSNVAATVVTILSIFFVDLFGRKVLLVLSGSAMIIGSVGLGTYFFVCSATNVNNVTFLQATAASTCNNNDFQWMIITFFVVHTVGFSTGWGTIPFILNSELFPLRIRGSLAGVATAINWACSALVSSAYAPFATLVHPYGAWWAFGIANLISTVCVAVFLPETKGAKLEEIEHFLQRKYRLCPWKQIKS